VSVADVLGLVERFGSVMFDCGEWRPEESEDDYDELANKASDLRCAIRKAIEALATVDGEPNTQLSGPKAPL
jgi:hypothetical protein